MPKRRKTFIPADRKPARYCNTCELPMIICACEEARLYDEANPFVLNPCSIDQT